MRIAEFSAQWEGRTIDAFPLRQLLGSGETSAVFLTTYDAHNAAIKLIPADAQPPDPQGAETQLAQWRDAQKLSHSNLIRILGMGRSELDGIPLLYIVMDRAEEDLSQVLPDRSLTAVEAREMLEPTLSALEYIHRMGFVHTRVKPSNIMAVEDRLKISSDGLLRSGTRDKKAATAYDPPEHATEPVSAASDVWSLGVTLVEVLTQRLPSNGIEPADLPEPFAGIARGCLLRNPADRLTIFQISKLLTPSEPIVVPRKRRYTPIGVLILLALVVITVAGVMIMQTNSNTAAPVTPAETIVKTPEPQVSPPPAEPKPQPKQIVKVTKTSEPKEPAPKEPAPAPETAAVPVSGIIEQPLPNIMDRARNTIHGRVRFAVRVDVAPSGTVSDAKLESSGASKYFSERALAAIRQWKFEPVSVNGSQVGQRWRVRFEFLKSGTKVQPQRISP